jgi:RNA polymerase sigma-70 factor (ECF subfamily)
LEAVRRGDAAAQGELLARFTPWLHLLARLQLDRDLQPKLGASDVVQQTLLEACRALPRFRGSSAAALAAWLRQILTHTLAHEIRRFKGTDRRALDREQALDAGLAASSRRLEALLAAPISSPSQQAVRHEEELRLAAVLARLPEDYRMVIELRHLQDLPHEEVARRLGRSAGATRMLWVRALARLRQEMEQSV